MNHFLFLFSVLLVSCLTVSCRNETPPSLEKVRLQLKWTHQAQFAGYYMAEKLGFFTEAGLQVELLQGGRTIDQTEQLLAGKAEFGVVPAESLVMKNTADLEMVAIAVIYQRNPNVYISKPEDKIFRPEDLVGKTVAVGGLEHSGYLEALVQFQALLKRQGIAPGQVTIVPYDPNYTTLLNGQAQVSPAYLVGGVPRLQEKGVELNLLWPGDYGIDLYSDTLVTTRSMIDKRPHLVQAFVKAALAGWQEAITNPELAVEVTMTHCDPSSQSLQQRMMEASIPLINTGLHPIGWMDLAGWQEVYQTYFDFQLVPQPIADLGRIFDRRFLDQARAEQTP